MIIPDWAKELNCSITVCDKDGVIIYQNDPAVRQYEKHGSLIGKNLFGCHGERSAGIIRHLLETGGTNRYTIDQEAWCAQIRLEGRRRGEGAMRDLHHHSIGDASLRQGIKDLNMNRQAARMSIGPRPE